MVLLNKVRVPGKVLEEKFDFLNVTIVCNLHFPFIPKKTHCYSLLSFEEVLEIVVFHPVVGLLTKGEDLPHGDTKGPGNLSFAQLYK